MKTVIISCIPQLNPGQEQGFIQLIGILQGKGYAVKIWNCSSSTALRQFEIAAPAAATGLLGRIKQALQSKAPVIDEQKWTERLKHWLNKDDNFNAKGIFQKHYNEALAIFKKYQPDLFICWNPFCCQFGIAYDLAKKMQVKTAAIEFGFLPGTFTIDKKGILALSELNVPAPELYRGLNTVHLQEQGKQVYQSLVQAGISRLAQQAPQLPTALQHTGAGTVNILVLANDEVDTGCIPAWHEERKWLLPFHTSTYQQALQIAALNPLYKVVFKPHPSHNRYSEDKQLTGNCFIVNGNPDTLINWADVVIASGSKMEFAALLQQKPLVNIGAGLLFDKGCSYEVKNVEAMPGIIQQASQNGCTEQQLQAWYTFLGYLKQHYLFTYTADANTAVNEAVVQALLH
ncbi:MAG TPA: hypothetical protein PKC39_09915 [Ferruginibacter sp.]|nr:hypothetical protein [Ferruginibacter sp.]HMP21264.1 hypothetical protein [Ferruginibacter sp.]